LKTRIHDVVPPPRRERAVLVGHVGRDGRDFDRSMEELARLADTAGARSQATLVQRRGTIHPATFIGKGKLEELRVLVQDLKAQLAIFNDDLSPPQVRNLEKALDVRPFPPPPKGTQEGDAERGGHMVGSARL